MNNHILTLELLKGSYSIYKFRPDYILDRELLLDDFSSITRTKDELSVVAKENSFCDYKNAENGWRIIKIKGILDFSLTGIISRISSILADVNISVFVISTFNTDYVMIKNETLEKAAAVLRENGYEVAD